MRKGQVSFQFGYMYISGVSGLPRVLEEEGQNPVFLEPTMLQGQYRFSVCYLTMNAFSKVAPLCLDDSGLFRFNRQFEILKRKREKAGEQYDALAPSEYEKMRSFLHFLPKQPYLYQQAGIEMIQREKRIFLGDTQGLGKTITSLLGIYSLRAFPALVVCPANVKFNWPEEALDWLPHIKVSCLTSSGLPLPPENGIPINDWGAHILVVNYDILSNLESRLAAFKFQSILVDESHSIKNRATERFRSLIKVIGDAPVRICMSGTPIPNRPEELLAQLEILDRLRDFGGEALFEETFCQIAKDEKVVELFAQQKLHDELKHSGFYMRRLKEKALPLLKKKELIVERIPIDNPREYQRAKEQFEEWCLENGVDIALALRGKAESGGKKKANSMTKMNSLKKVVTKGKMRSIKRWISTFLERHPEQKLLVFLMWRSTMDELRDEFDCLWINGDVPADERPRIKRQFEDPNGPRVLFASIQAANAGITLHANGLCRTVLTIELHWNGAVHEQAEDRVHRIGQKHPVSCITLLGQGTLEEEIYDLIRAKTNQSAQILSGKRAQSVSEVAQFSGLDAAGGS